MSTLSLRPKTTSAGLTQIRESREAAPLYVDWREEAKAVTQNLGRLFPAVFNPATRLPLALNIHEALAEEINLPPVTIKTALKWWTGHGRYLQAVIEGTHRHDLQGDRVAEIKAGHKQHAREKLAEQKARRIAKQQAAKPAKPKPHVATQHRLNQLAAKFNGGLDHAA